MLSFLVYTLGCKLNQLESEAITDAFSHAGFVKAGIGNRGTGTGRQSFEDSPAVIVINTCTVTSKADQKARRVIRKALRDYPDAGVIVTGCYAQLNKDDILALETDGGKRLHVVKKDNILDYIKNNDTFFSPRVSASLRDNNGIFQFNPKNFSAHTRSFLKIQDGCGKHCTYCKIRLARGPSVSLPAEEALSRLRILEQNHAEAALTGVNISQYVTGRVHTETQRRKDHREEEEKVFGLSELLDYLLSNTGKIAIRLSSLAPESIDEKLCAVLSHPRIRPHFHLSIQSCSEKILAKMGRDYNAQTIEKAAALLRGIKNDPFLACDIIAGFPGETETEFEQTLSLCQKLDFAWIHVFPFSKRQGTQAFSFAHNAAESEVTKRVKRLADLAEQGKARYVRRWLGREVEVVIINKRTEAHCRGVSENYLKVLVNYNGEKPPVPGEVVICGLTETSNEKDIDVYGDYRPMRDKD